MNRLTAYLGGRLLSAAFTEAVGAVALFLIVKAIPGNPALVVLGEYASPGAIAAFNREYHLDEPLAWQFWHWLLGAVHGNFGHSMTIAGGTAISALVAQRLPNTVFIGIYALVLAVLFSLVAGTVAATRRGSAVDTLATSVAVIGISMPDFWLSYVLIMAFALSLHLFPSYGFVSPTRSLAGALYSGFLPAVAIAAPMAAVFARILRASLLEVIQRQYVIVARSFGFRERFIFVAYVLRNALIPYITTIGLQVRYLLGGVVIIEKVFGIAGLGSLLVNGALGHDFPVVLACGIVFLTIVLLVNLGVDLTSSALDPRRSH